MSIKNTFIFSLSAFILTASHAHATNIEAKTVTDNYLKQVNAFEQLLIEKEKPQVISEFMNDTIDNDVKIQVEVIDKKNTPKKLNISKKDYINSYIYGAYAVKDYNISITVDKVAFDPETQTLLAAETTVESGTKLNPWNAKEKGVDFTTKTTCYSFYTVTDDSTPQLSQSACKVIIAEEEQA